jgi:hypothetical protein
MVSRCGTGTWPLARSACFHAFFHQRCRRSPCHRVTLSSGPVHGPFAPGVRPSLLFRLPPTRASTPSDSCAGFSIPLNIIPSASDCPAPECAVNINPLCPGTLRTAISENGLNLACMHPCNAGYGQETFGNRDCCTGASKLGSVSSPTVHYFIGQWISCSGSVRIGSTG